jgi:hypothetical protein
MKTKLNFLFITLLSLSLPKLVEAQFSYTINGGAVTITGYNAAVGLNVIIPSVIQGHPVSSIGDSAFAGSGITNVIIPESVTNIGQGAFSQCSKLTNLIIPNSVSNIGISAFNYCFSLTSVTIPNGVPNIGYLTFCNCRSLTNATIGNSVTNIDFEAFSSCSNMISVIIGNNVASIGRFAFAQCYKLTSVTIPNSVTSIGEGAFESCETLSSAYFLGNAPSDGGYVFSTPATVYYLPGTTGWGSTFGGVPTVLWNPQANSAGIAFSITGPTNAIFVVEACSNLSNPVWLPVATNTFSTSGISAFSDPQWTNFPGRFYRFRSP